MFANWSFFPRMFRNQSFPPVWHGFSNGLTLASLVRMQSTIVAESIAIEVAEGRIEADLRLPRQALGLVVFAHGSGSSRFSRRNREVAEFLEKEGFATLLLDLLTSQEESVDIYTRQYRFDIDLLGHRVVRATDWAHDRTDLRHLAIGYFGASTGAAAALIGAAERPALARAVVSRGGRPDLAGTALAKVRAPTLLIVGGDDEPVITMNREAMQEMTAPVDIEIVPGATHLFEEPGTLEQVMDLAGAWFHRYLK
jgi:putative phosphoribosyl transferase